MNKVVSVSLFGNNKKYLIGLKANLELIRLFYPGWITYIYFDKSVPESYLEEVRGFDNIKFLDMSDSNLPGMFWRFLPYDDNNVELYIIRDLDSRVSIREAFSVYEWIKSNSNLHIMRDHPHHHYLILGGMWGLKNNFKFSMQKEIEQYIYQSNKSAGKFERMLDMDFLRDIIYPKFRYSKMVHASYHKYEFFVNKIIPDRFNNSFIGEIIGEDGFRTDHYKFIKN